MLDKMIGTHNFMRSFRIFEGHIKIANCNYSAARCFAIILVIVDNIPKIYVFKTNKLKLVSLNVSSS